jgi:hypothetical protein
VTEALDAMNLRPEDKPDRRDVAFAFLLALSTAHPSIMLGRAWSGVEFDHDELCERATHAATAYLEAQRPA